MNIWKNNELSIFFFLLIILQNPRHEEIFEIPIKYVFLIFFIFSRPSSVSTFCENYLTCCKVSLVEK